MLLALVLLGGGCTRPRLGHKPAGGEAQSELVTKSGRKPQLVLGYDYKGAVDSIHIVYHDPDAGHVRMASRERSDPGSWWHGTIWQDVPS